MKKTHKCSGNTQPRTRKFAVTCWDEPEFNSKQMKYLVVGLESCPTTGRKHYQCFVYFFNAKTMLQCKKFFGNDSHIEDCKGTINDNVAYCTKDDNYKEYGELPLQGKRTDLNEIKDNIKDGMKVDTIAIEQPEIYHQYGRTLNKIEDIVMRNKYRTEMTQGLWYYGPTGVGKSHKAFEGYTPSTHYVLPDDNGWWDGYTQQDTVIINDFRGRISYDFMLQLVDKWPVSVKRRGREPIPFISKTVIITSPLRPEEVYHNRCEKDDIAQLLRRFEIIDMDNTMDVTVEDNTLQAPYVAPAYASPEGLHDVYIGQRPWRKASLIKEIYSLH